MKRNYYLVVLVPLLILAGRWVYQTNAPLSSNSSPIDEELIQPATSIGNENRVSRENSSEINSPIDSLRHESLTEVRNGILVGLASLPDKTVPLKHCMVELKEMNGKKRFFYRYLDSKGEYSIPTPPGEYQVSLRVKDSLFFGPTIEIFSEKTSSYNFILDSGFDIHGSFQNETSPHASTFNLDLIRQSDSRIISRTILYGAPPRKNTPAIPDPNDLDQGDKFIDGSFRLRGVPAGSYILRFSVPMKSPNDEPKFFWEFEASILNKDFDFGNQFADYSAFSN